MRRHTIKRVIVFGSIAYTIFLYSSIALAGIGVDPPVTEIEAVQGQEKTGFFTVVNGDKEPVSVKIEPEDWLKIRTGSSPSAPSEWLTMDEVEFDLGPLEERKIGYRVNVDKDVGGELIAQVFFASAAPSDGGNLNITSRFGVALYVGIEGSEIIEPAVKEIKSDKSVISVTVENRGNVHIRPFGKVTIKDSRGDITQEADIPYTAVIFGGKSNSYAVRLDEKKFSRGRYTITADLNTGTIYGKSKAFSKTVDFYRK